MNYTTKFEYNSCVFFLFSSRCCCRFSALYSYKNSLLHSFIHSVPTSKNIYYYLFIQFFCLFVATIQRWKRVPYIHKCIQHTTHSVRATDDSCVALSPNSTNKNNNKIHSHPFISLLHYFFYPIILFVSAIFILGYFFFSSLRGIDIVRE